MLVFVLSRPAIFESLALRVRSALRARAGSFLEVLVFSLIVWGYLANSVVFAQVLQTEELQTETSNTAVINSQSTKDQATRDEATQVKKASDDGAAADPIAALQEVAVETKVADWGHWGPNEEKYSSWVTHSNRLIPIYTIGGKLDSVRGRNSVYRSEKKLEKLYGRQPSNTYNPKADYFDQTDVYRLQTDAVAAGKKRIILFVFDGMDWQTSQAAAIAKNHKVTYQAGKGSGLRFQDYARTVTDFGWFVSSPHNNGTNVNVDKQIVKNPGGKTAGGYNVELGGDTPWSKDANAYYLIADHPEELHAYTDSAASATSMTSGIKTYNNAINVDAFGREVLPIARVLQDDGFAVGAVTSVPISHATPACSYANNVHRGDYQDITRDMLGQPSVFHPGGLSGLDVLIGGGWGVSNDEDGTQGKNFVAGNRYLTDKDLGAINVDHGGEYVVALRTEGEPGRIVLSDAVEQAVDGKHRLFGYFGVGGGHLPFQTADGGFDPVVSVGTTGAAEVYSEKDVIENPELGDMAAAAIEVLNAKSDRWWLMIEAGDVDWANHSNNIDNSIGAVLSGEVAFNRVVHWIESHGGWDETLMILTADHGHYFVLDKPEALAGEG